MKSLLKTPSLALILATILSLTAPHAQADGLTDLKKFMETAKSGEANFSQTVTSPSKNGLTPQPKISTGVFEFQRPGKFKFIYQKPYAQQIVADGTNLWLYDPDLEQITKKNQQAAFTASPIALLVRSQNIKELNKKFTLSNAPDAQGLSWVKAVPKPKDTGLQYIQVGFKSATLQSMVILDSFGQKSAIIFINMKTNPEFSKNNFTFIPPKGVSVISE